MSFKFQKPTAEEEKRMTVTSISVALNAFKTQRKNMVKEIDEQIAYYEDLLKEKQEPASA